MENERFDRQNSRPNDAAERNNSELNRGNQETTNTLHSAVTASLGSQTGVKSLYSGQVKDGTFSSSLSKDTTRSFSSGYIDVRTGSERSLTSETKRKSLLFRRHSLDDINTSSCNFPSSKDTTQSFSSGYIDVRIGSERSLTSETIRKSLLFRRHSLHNINTRSPALPSSFGSLPYSKADSNSYADVKSIGEISHSRLSAESNISIGSGLNHSILQTYLNPYEDVKSGSEILHPLLAAESSVYESFDSGLNDSIRPIDSTPHDEVISGSQIEHSCPPAGESNDRRGCSKKQMALVIVLLVTVIVTLLGVGKWEILETSYGLHIHVPPKELTTSQGEQHRWRQPECGRSFKGGSDSNVLQPCLETENKENEPSTSQPVQVAENPDFGKKRKLFDQRCQCSEKLLKIEEEMLKEAKNMRNALENINKTLKEFLEFKRLKNQLFTEQVLFENL